MATNAVLLAKREGINWTATTAFIVFHIGAVAALFFFTWPAFLTAVFLYWVSLSLGIGMGYHRLLTHRSYVPPKWIEYFLAVRGTLAMEGGPLSWVTTHRIHHRFSDQDGDPHTPRDGKWWSHIIWMTVGDATNCTPERVRALFPGPLQRPIPGFAFEVFLRSFGARRDRAVCDRRPAVCSVGNIFSRDGGAARDLDGQFTDPFLGESPVRHFRTHRGN